MELQLQVTEEELLEFPEVRSDQINTSQTDNMVVLSVLGKVASRIAVEAVEAVVQIHIPRLKLKTHATGDEQHIEDGQSDGRPLNVGSRRTDNRQLTPYIHQLTTYIHHLSLTYRLGQT